MSRVRRIRARLRDVYGVPVARAAPRAARRARPHRPVQSTNDRNRDVAFLRLRERFGGSWEAVRDAPLAEVEEAIRPGGLHRQKSVRIQEILRAIGGRAGRCPSTTSPSCRCPRRASG